MELWISKNNSVLVVVLLLYVHCRQLYDHVGMADLPSTLFLERLRSPQRFTSTK